ncbi:MAG: NDP-hexose 2,3-dehydratase [Sedimenticola sp.]|nr:MAG: NDP-hexose 2,3-dehydratase [Sedimenticola sp.]
MSVVGKPIKREGQGLARGHDNVERLRRDLSKVLHFPLGSHHLDLYLSALTEHNPFYPTEEIQDWLTSLNEKQLFNVERIPFRDLRKWRFHPETGDLEHESGGFFAIRGLHVKTNAGNVSEWTQPIIHQPEIGVLGIIAKRINGVLYLLLQAKAEPGNLNTYQLSPTVQATRSNYLCLHGGKPTRYLEYFLDPSRAVTLIDQLQSEQGARFYCKRNRNIIVRVPDDEEISLGPNHRWVSIGQLLKLMRLHNTVNMDTRSVISHVSYAPEHVTSLAAVDRDSLRDCLARSPLVADDVHPMAADLMMSAHATSPSLMDSDQLIARITREKFRTELDVKMVPLKSVRGWNLGADEIAEERGRFFSVIGVRVEADSREVGSWDQPIVRQQNEGIVGLIAKKIDGVLHFLMQLKVESGVMDLMELAPTVQCITGSYSKDHLPPFVEHFLHSSALEAIVDVNQSEEGGRFFEESNRNVVLLAGDDFPVEVPPQYLWMTMRQLKRFIMLNNYLNIETRSLVACVPWS